MRPARDGDRTLAEARAPKIFVPEIPDSIQAADLDRQVKARLRTLSKDNAEDVARHLLMADATLELDPERAYQHAMVAAQRGGRVDVVRECMAITAYATGRYAEALREFRTVRRLNGSNAHLAAMADCERGLGRPERAIALAASDEASSVTGDPLVELRIVVAGARIDMGEPDAAVLILSRLTSADPETTLRIGEAHVEALRAAGRDADADTLQASLPVREIETIDLNEDLIVYDLEEFDVPVEDIDQAHDDEGMTP